MAVSLYFRPGIEPRAEGEGSRLGSDPDEHSSSLGNPQKGRDGQ